jgi:thioredoxin reductase (NADPH)
MQQMRAQAERFGTQIITDDAVSLTLNGDMKIVKDSSGNEYRSRAVILAMGSGYRELGIPGEKRLSGHGVSWCATCDGFFFRGANIAVIGGGDSAMEEATFLTRFAEKVYIIHRRDSLRASKAMQERAFKDPKIEFLWNTETLEVLGEEKVTGLKIKNSQTNVDEILAVTGVFVAIGHNPRSELVRSQVDLDTNGYVLVKPGSTQTNLSGVFACGDLVDHVYRQAITAAGTGTMAALDTERWLADSHQTIQQKRKEEVNA